MTQSVFLAAENGGAGNVPVIILLAALGAFAVAYFVVGPGRRKGPKRHGDIPLSMRPYHSDEELETTGLERAMAWGVALAVFSSLFLPLYWLIEPNRQNQRVDEHYQQDVAQGRAEYQNACASCHGTELGGGSAPHPDPDIDAAWPAPALNNIVARYEESEIVEDPFDLIMQTLRRGRPGTPMQAFSEEAGGSLNDQQLEAIATYILSVQTGELPDGEAFVGASGDNVFEANCARCHGPDAEGYVGPQLLNVFERYGAEEGDEASLEQARAAVRHAIENGRYVPGEQLMPPFGDVLSEDAIDAVIEHIEQLQETGGPSYGQLGPDATTSAEE
jgi:mono/diheme cytochrome c family protein